MCGCSLTAPPLLTEGASMSSIYQIWVLEGALRTLPGKSLPRELRNLPRLQYCGTRYGAKPHDRWTPNLVLLNPFCGCLVELYGSCTAQLLGAPLALQPL